MSGALSGLRIVEMLGLGPAPFAAMMLADQGAEVIRIERPDAAGMFEGIDRFDVLARSRTVVAVDMKTADGLAVARDLLRGADGLIEGFRPGVMERLGLGPDVLLAENPRLVYGRMTGWGQDGPLAMTAGHDINYIAVNGVLSTIARRGERPVPPANYVADFGGGGMLLAFGMTTALLAVARGGPGQVVDAAMVDGSALLSGLVWQLKAAGMWGEEPGTNLLDGGAHFYDSFVCADGRFVAIGAIEPQFYAALRRILGVADDPDFDDAADRSRWPALHARVAAVIATRTRDEWCAAFGGHEACFAPVMTLDEAPDHPHVAARRTFVRVAGQIQPAPAPRFSMTPSPAPRPARHAGGDVEAVLRSISYSDERIAALKAHGIVG